MHVGLLIGRAQKREILMVLKKSGPSDGTVFLGRQVGMRSSKVFLMCLSENSFPKGVAPVHRQLALETKSTV